MNRRSWLTGDPAADGYISKVAGPGWAEVASVAGLAGLAGRLHLGGPGTPRRYAWGQALRRAVLAVLLVHAVLAVNVLVFLVWSRRLVGWLPAPPGSLVVAPAGVWATVYYLVCLAWIAIFVSLVLGHHRTARILAALAVVPGLVALLQAQLTDIMPAPFGPWVFWVLVDLAPVLAMTAFHRDGPPGRNRSTCSAGLKPSSSTTCWSRLADRRCFRAPPPPEAGHGAVGLGISSHRHAAPPVAQITRSSAGMAGPHDSGTAAQIGYLCPSAEGLGGKGFLRRRVGVGVPAASDGGAAKRAEVALMSAWRGRH